jgi:hypothetical protein
LDTAAPSLPAIVDADRPCIRCGYSLRGLPSTGPCPECATPVQRSLMGDLLFYSDPAYVATLRRGTTATIVTLCLVLALTFGGGVLRSALPGAAPFVPYAGLAVYTLFALAWWWLTTPDAGQLTENKGERPRRVVRLCMLALLAVKALNIVLPELILLTKEARTALDSLDTLVLGIGLTAGMMYLRWLSPRLPNYIVYKGAEQQRVMLIITTILYALKLLLTLLDPFISAPTPGTRLPIAVLTSAGSGLVSLVGGIMALICFVMFWTLMSRLRTNLVKLSAEQVRQGLVVA